MEPTVLFRVEGLRFEGPADLVSRSRPWIARIIIWLPGATGHDY